MAQIEVNPIGEWTFEVTVTDADSSSRHVVTVETDDLERLGRGESAERLVEASFHFLLEREPKESILAEFDLSVIGRYFAEYQDRIGEYL